MLNLLDMVGYDTSTVNQTAMYEALWSVWDWENFVLDRYAIKDFLMTFMNIDVDTFDQVAWDNALNSFAIQYMPYDVHYILNLLDQVGYDTSSINQTAMFEILSGIDYENFVLDEYIILSFFEDLGIDPSTFDQEIWA